MDRCLFEYGTDPPDSDGSPHFGGVMPAPIEECDSGERSSDDFGGLVGSFIQYNWIDLAIIHTQSILRNLGPR